MDVNRVEGTARKVSGKVQEGVGRVTGDAQTHAEPETLTIVAEGEVQERAKQEFRHATRQCDQAVPLVKVAFGEGRKPCEQGKKKRGDYYPDYVRCSRNRRKRKRECQNAMNSTLIDHAG
jgi:uncharacterized protein YjbJ (UPF0337 family)